jgi:hypothetical protein
MAVNLWGRNGFYSRMSLVCGIAGMIFCPDHCIRKGALDITDYKTFPQRPRAFEYSFNIAYR